MIWNPLRAGRERRAADAAVRADLKARIARLAGLGTADGVAVNAVACGDPACPGGVETIALIMRAGEPTQAVKVPGAMADVTDDALRAALATLAR